MNFPCASRSCLIWAKISFVLSFMVVVSIIIFHSCLAT
jgi:hypothetical protein